VEKMMAFFYWGNKLKIFVSGDTRYTHSILPFNDWATAVKITGIEAHLNNHPSF